MKAHTRKSKLGIAVNRKAAAARLRVSVNALRVAANAGAPGFLSNKSIDCDVLRVWLRAHPDLTPTVDDYERERVLKLKAQREIAELELAVMRGDLRSAKQLAAALFQLYQEERSTLWQRVVDQLPSIVVGMDVESTREIAKGIVNDILKKHQEFAKQWNP